MKDSSKLGILAVGMLLLLACASGSEPAREHGNIRAASDLQGSFLWLGSAPEGRQVYAAFRKRFELAEAPETASLRLFADSRYILWINGEYMERGPCRFDPISPEYDTMDIGRFLRPGTNAIAVLVHYYHDGKSSSDPVPINGRMMRHAPGLTARLDLTLPRGRTMVLRTDRTWRGTTRTRFLPSPAGQGEDTWSSIPDRIDARIETGDWAAPDFDDSSWEQAVPVDGQKWGALRARSIPRLRETLIEPLLLLDTASKPLADAFPINLVAGGEVVIDAGRFVQAYTVLEFDAEEGSRIETEHAQRYYQTGRRPSESYGRVNRYIARAGRQTYVSGDTFGFKYLVIRVAAGRVRLSQVRVINRVYPFDVLGRFQSDDDRLNRLWQYSVNTVRICSEDAYVDCATRERVEWMADGYVQAYRVTRVALAGPGPEGLPRFGDPRLLRNLLRHIGQSAQPDGRVKAHHPSDRWDIHGYIEDYACLWIQAIREYYDHTGDLDLARELWPAVRGQLQWFLDRRTERGLVKARDFVYPGSNPLCYKVGEGTTLNAYLVRSLQDAAFLAGRMGVRAQERIYATAAQGLRDSINQHLWDEAAGTYRGGFIEGQLQALTLPAAFISLDFDIAPPARRSRVQEWLLAHHQEYGGLPYAFQFLFEALYGIDTQDADRRVLDIIRQKWSAMAEGETQTVWEGFGPGENCHESGSVPAYFLSAYVLGVRLDGPVSKRRLRIEPHLGDLKWAEGVVVTELGPVPVRWQWQAAERSLEFEIEIPRGSRATVALPTAGEHPTVFLDAKKLSGARVQIKGRYALVEVGPGLHRGRLALASPGR